MSESDSNVLLTLTFSHQHLVEFSELLLIAAEINQKTNLHLNTVLKRPKPSYMKIYDHGWVPSMKTNYMLKSVCFINLIRKGSLTPSPK